MEMNFLFFYSSSISHCLCKKPLLISLPIYKPNRIGFSIFAKNDPLIPKLLLIRCNYPKNKAVRFGPLAIR
jgi:hypothetical protein